MTLVLTFAFAGTDMLSSASGLSVLFVQALVWGVVGFAASWLVQWAFGH